MTTLDASPRTLPRPYLAWLAGSTVARLGDAVLAFALGWAAAGLGGTTAALVLTLGGLPRLVLLVVGGAVADRVGARRLLVAGEVALLALTVLLAVALTRSGAATWLLLASSLALGTVTAFCLPATGSMPRRLVPDDQLARALALRQGAGQTLLLVAAPVGGVLVGAAGLPAVAWAAAVTTGVSLCVLVAVRELAGPARDGVTGRGAPGGADPGGGVPGGARRAAAGRLDLLDGVRIVRGTPGLRRALVLAGAGAGLLLPVPSLLVPLLGRSSGWGPGATGAVAGAVGVGAIAAALRAARRRVPVAAVGVPLDARGLGVHGLGVSAVGVSVLAAGALPGRPGGVAAAVVGALVLGFGNGTLAARLAPVVLGSTPRSHLARVQALVGLAQLVPVLVTTALLGALAERTSPGWALAATAAGLVGCTAAASRGTDTPART